MDNFNKVISFVLGLVVVVVLLVILTGRFNLRERFLPLGRSKGPTTTVTPTPKTTAKNGQKITPTPTPAKIVFNYDYHPYRDAAGAIAGTSSATTKGGLITIPKTGPTFLVPLVLSALLGGVYLRKQK